MNQEKTNHCILCGSERIKKIFTSQNTHGRHLVDTKDTFDVFMCFECECIFLEKININDAYYKKNYQEGYYEDNKKGILRNILTLLTKYVFKKKQALILRHFKKDDQISILDIGCGTGEFLSHMDKNKFNKSGVEINPEGAAMAKKKNFEIYNQNILDININKKFDVITMWHVLEHLPDPVAILNKMHTMFSDDGILIIEVPNTDSLGFKYGREKWFHMDSPRHLMNYNKKSIKKLCQMTNFIVKEIKSEMANYPLDLFWSVRRSPIKYLIYPFYPIAKWISKETLMFICTPKKIY